MLHKHDLPYAPAKTTIRESYLMRTAEHDAEFLYGIAKEGAGGPSSRTRSRDKRERGGDSTRGWISNGHASVYRREPFDLFAEGGKAPVGLVQVERAGPLCVPR